MFIVCFFIEKDLNSFSFSRTMYDTIAPGYDRLYGEEQEKKLKKIAHVLRGRILDIGAGTGIVAKYFPHVVSFDPSWNMLKRAKGMKVLGNAEYLPFKAGSFDTVVSLTALHHTRIRRVIKELKRINAPNMAFTILKKSKGCPRIVFQLQKTFGMKMIEDEKDVLLIKKVKH